MCEKSNKGICVPSGDTYLPEHLFILISADLLCLLWVAMDQWYIKADSEDYDQTGQMHRLIRLYSGHSCHSVRFVIR